MRKFRRSNKSNDLKQPNVRISTKDAIAINPPKKVVVATYPYTPEPERGSDYLSFGVGDFFHVIDREDDLDWYEVLDAKGKRGLVPRPYVEEVGKKDLRGKSGSQPQPHDSGYSDGATVGGPDAAEDARKRSTSTGGTTKKGNMVYGYVIYDFQAERADELQASAGESIIIIAQSNPEWYVAKPIMRLGGPGLIPSSFVEIRNTTTNLPVDNALDAVRAAGIPKVEEWKHRAAWYKNNSVPLGKVSAGPQQSMQQGMERLSIGTTSTRQSNENYQSSQDGSSQHRSGSSHEQRNTLQAQPSSRLMTPKLARVTGFERNPSDGLFYYRVEVLYEDGRAWRLLRIYTEFFDLQVHLMEQFPHYAGKVPGHQRILPQIPGPVPNATPQLTARRQPHMHQYVYELLQMRADINNSHPTRLFFSPREIDHEIQPFDERDINRFSTNSQQSQQSSVMGGISQQSSSTSVNVVNGVGGHISPPRQQQSYSQISQYYSNSPPDQQDSTHYRSPSELTVPNGAPNGRPPQLRNNSAMTATSGVSANSRQPGGGSSSIVKIKVFLGENCILLRLSSDFTFTDLESKLRERWLLEPGNETSNDVQFSIDYKDEPTQAYYPIASDEDLDIAKERNDKLTLRVNQI